MATIPTVPTFTPNTAPSIATLNQLSYAVSFLVDNGVRPGWSIFMNSTQSPAATTWTNIAYDHTAYATDATRSGGTITLNTQGYYEVAACLSFETNANDTDVYTAAFVATGGGNNPNLVLNATQYFGYGAGRFSSTAEAPADNALCITDIAPLCLYPGDTLNVAVYLSAAHVVDINQNSAYNIGRFAAKFSGHLIRTGP